jgi:hypothetical protein
MMTVIQQMPLQRGLFGIQSARLPQAIQAVLKQAQQILTETK